MPLGPDGLPMPYWLYKLHGLDREYPCEICANRIYNGRRTFERHFNEETHLYHLRCLGIEPSSVFKGITKIAEAQRLWKNTQSQPQFVSSIAAVPAEKKLAFADKTSRWNGTGRRGRTGECDEQEGLR